MLTDKHWQKIMSQLLFKKTNIKTCAKEEKKH